MLRPRIAQNSGKVDDNNQNGNPYNETEQGYKNVMRAAK